MWTLSTVTACFGCFVLCSLTCGSLSLTFPVPYAYPDVAKTGQVTQVIASPVTHQRLLSPGPNRAQFCLCSLRSLNCIQQGFLCSCLVEQSLSCVTYAAKPQHCHVIHPRASPHLGGPPRRHMCATTNPTLHFQFAVRLCWAAQKTVTPVAHSVFLCRSAQPLLLPASRTLHTPPSKQTPHTDSARPHQGISSPL